jgi:multimeric flavodoxin WrbA
VKVLGISCGRNLGNSEIMVKEALMGSEELGARVEIIRMHDLNIRPCTGCESCRIRELKEGGMQAKCIIENDDMPFFVEKLLECDGAIVGAPIFHLMPPGFLTMIGNRMAIIGTRFRQKPRYSAHIMVGGTDWISLALPLMAIFLPHDFKLVDQMVVTYTPRPGQILLNGEAMARVRRLGRHIAEAIQTPPNEVMYVGDSDGRTCPLCHQNLLVVRESSAECPICGIQGKIELTGSEIKVNFDEEGIKSDRWSQVMMTRHLSEVQRGHKMYEERKEELKKKLELYRSYLPFTCPTKKKRKRVHR